MATTDQLLNTLFDKRYRIMRKLGSGGMANVYLAEDQELGRRVAIKILNDRHAGDEQFIERFRREAKNAAGLSHPNIVSIYDRGEAEGTYYIAMEYLDGRSLKELILTRGPAPVSVAVDYARQMLSALRFAHRNGIVHRDIKPHNVLVDAEGHLKVTDFGIARAGASQMTEEGSIIGTAQYLSPEQARGTKVDQTSDLYSVGIVLYEMLSGQVPFTGDSPVEIAMKHLSATPPPLRAKRPDIPESLELVVMRALAKDPTQRYQSAEEMDADLDRVARGLAVSRETEDAATTVLRGAAYGDGAATTIAPAVAVTEARPPLPPAPDYFDYVPPPRRRSIWPWLLAILLVAAAVVAGFFVYRQIQDQLNQAKPVGVPYVVGLREASAVHDIRAAGLEVKAGPPGQSNIHRLPNTDQPKGYVYDQTPNAGDRVGKGSFVDIYVSTGKPQVLVPGVVGKTSNDAVAALTAKGLVANVFKISSDKPADTVIAQDPKGGTKVYTKTKVRINVSSGPKPISIPDVRGSTYPSASSQLQALGFAVARAPDVQSNTAAAGIVIDQQPAGGTSAAKGSTITLTVSKGPQTTGVPNVEGSDQQGATTQLQKSGFKVAVQRQDTTDPTLDGIVLSQTPAGGTQAKPGATVTITVGHYAAQATTTTSTTTAATTTTPGGQ